jgi:anaerobic magnesium-protoporphyrin IX monomethyl ester cyclase
MKITLISTATFPSDQGIRTISSVLKKQGNEVKTIFLKFSEDYKKFYPKKILQQITHLSKDSDLIGINSFASTAPRAIQVIKYLKSKLPKKPIVWGGIHATISPEKCIEHCDIVAVGEAEDAILDLTTALENNKPINKIPNLWVRDKKTNNILKNPVRSLIDDLDTLPPVDYNIENHYILEKNKLIPFREQDLNGEIFFLTGRGCPYGCDYCSNDFLNKLYEGKRKKIVRYHSPEYIIDIILDLKSRFKTLTYFDIRDDTFSLRPIEEIKKFCTLYKQKVNMRFKCLGDPKTISEEKIKLLVDAGCTDIIIGIQGVERVNKEIYHRNQTDKQVLNAAKILNKYKNKFAVMYDVITSNPYEKPEDIIGMIRLLQSLPKPYFVSINNLVFFTSTPLYCKAKEDGIIKKEKDSAANLNYWDRSAHIRLKKKNMYLNLILNMMRGSVTKSRFGPTPNFLINYLLKPSRIRRHLKNTFPTQVALSFISLSDLIREKILKPAFRSTPLSFRVWYDKIRYRV